MIKKRWTKEDTNYFISARKDNISYKIIAHHLGITEMAAIKKAQRLRTIDQRNQITHPCKIYKKPKQQSIDTLGIWVTMEKIVTWLLTQGDLVIPQFLPSNNRELHYVLNQRWLNASQLLRYANQKRIDEQQPIYYVLGITADA